MKVPFNRPTVTPNCNKYVNDAIASNHTCGDGPYTKRCSELLERVLGVKKVLLTTSGTHALELAALLLVDDALDAVMSTFTFSSTANAFMLHGIRPVLVDIDETLNLDVKQVEDVVNEHSIVVPMHYAGVGCKMGYLKKIGLPMVEDNAHGLFGKWQGQWLGTFGCVAALSFHETKNLTMGEGGALLINDERYVEQAEILREKGTNRTQFKRGQVDKYTWTEVGSSYLPSDILAAHLWAQLECWEQIQSKRWQLWKNYQAGLSNWAKNNDVRLPYVPCFAKQSYHMFYLLMPDLETRTRFIKYLASKDISATFHYIPLHLSPMGERLGYRAGQLPVAEQIADRLVRLPFYTDMMQEEQEYVIAVIRDFK